jgi:NRAMP (natural resistance-associated macrophage protein)-like metal ion transporter
VTGRFVLMKKTPPSKTGDPQPPSRQPLRRFAQGRIGRFFGELGPGLITGAADDDPSGISTYSVTGATFGFAQLWTALFAFPLMTAVQLMCARLGLVAGQGLAAVIRRRYPRWVLWGACALLAFANIVNIGADLSGMAEAMEMMTGLPAVVWTPLFAALIVALLVWSSYQQMARVFKWLTLVLFAYVFAAFLSHPGWPEVIKATFVPHVEWSAGYLATFVAILGTTISPYLFFWQTAQEVEEERAAGRKTIKERRGATDEELRAARRDVITGMAFAGVVMYFIIVATGATLYKSGQRDIETARQAAEALRPLAGPLASLLFTIGLVGTGMLGIPALAGSAAYAVAEALHWRGSLDDKPRIAPKFYGVLAAAVALGLALNVMKMNAVKMLFYAAVINGVLAPPLIVLVILLTSDKRIMGKCTSSPLLKTLGWLTALVMAAASVAMFLV